MNQKQYDIVAKVSILLIVISLAFIGLELTGRATDTGIVNITIISNAAINFTTASVDFGLGAVLSGASAFVDTEGNAETNGNWSAPSTGLVLENIGNVNVTLNISSDKDADAFIGGTSPSFRYKVTNSSEPSSCDEPGALTYTELSGANQPACGALSYHDGNDVVEVDFNLTIPSDSNTGTLGALITATANAI